MSKQQKVELARSLCASGSPVNKSQLARVLGIARSSLYVQCKRPRADKALAVRIEAAHEKDDIMGHRTRQVLLIAFDYHMRADLVTDAIQTMSFEVPGSIWHSDQGKQYGARQTRQLLLQKGFVLSMSRAGTPTDNGYAE
jgi:transposase InsO family protein